MKSHPDMVAVSLGYWKNKGHTSTGTTTQCGKPLSSPCDWVSTLLMSTVGRYASF